jgi:hypothetical protein
MKDGNTSNRGFAIITKKRVRNHANNIHFGFAIGTVSKNNAYFF